LGDIKRGRPPVRATLMVVRGSTKKVEDVGFAAGRRNVHNAL